MPDIDPAALSRPTGTMGTAVTMANSLPQKIKSNPLVPPRIDLEPLYVSLRSAITAEQWKSYKNAISKFLIGHMSTGELNSILNPILCTAEKEHLHNRLIAGIHGNITREMPEAGLAPWVSANDKPVVAAPAKPSSTDAAERQLKGEIMQLPTRDRRRIKNLTQAETSFDPFKIIANVFAETHRKGRVNAVVDGVAASKDIEMNLDNEVRKRFAAPLAADTGEFPDVAAIESRMLPMCYQAGLQSGHSPDAVSLMVNATDSFIKSVIANILSRTRSNGPGEGSSTGFGLGTGWIQTRDYKRKLMKEEEAALRGEVFRDKSGLLPIEAKAASERGPLTMSDLRLALDLGENGFANFPAISTTLLNGYRDGELENTSEYSLIPSEARNRQAKEDKEKSDEFQFGTNFNAPFKIRQQPQPAPVLEPMDVDNSVPWDGAECGDEIDMLLDSCLSGPL